MNDKEKKRKNWQNPIQLDDLLPQEDVKGGFGGRKLIFGAVTRNQNKSDRKENQTK